MAKLQRRIVSGARVMFDPRTTAEADKSRDPRNYVTEQAPKRRERWEKRKEASGAANRR
jgi:hypothetical protein